MKQCEDTNHKQNEVVIRRAMPDDIPAIVKMMNVMQQERGAKCWFDPYHTWPHVTDLVCNGVSFVASLDSEAVGVVMCEYIELPYAKTKSLETAHLYVVPDKRQSRIVFDLLTAIEMYIKSQKIKLVIHYLDYLSVIEGGSNDLQRVVKLFEKRGYQGPIGDVIDSSTGHVIGQSYCFIPEN